MRRSLSAWLTKLPFSPMLFSCCKCIADDEGSQCAGRVAHCPLVLSLSKGERDYTKPDVFPLWFDKLTMSGRKSQALFPLILSIVEG